MEDIICKCGNIIESHEIDYRNGTNEEGEEYGEAEVTCLMCGKEYSTNQWGNFEGKWEAIQLISDKVKEENSF